MGILEIRKDAFKIAKSIGNIELQTQILELQEQALELVTENRSLKDELAKLNEAMTISGELTPRENAYFRVSNGGQEDGPFCTRCWDVDSRLVRLREYGTAGTKCPNCDQWGKVPRGYISKIRRG